MLPLYLFTPVTLLFFHSPPRSPLWLSLTHSQCDGAAAERERSGWPSETNYGGAAATQKLSDGWGSCIYSWGNWQHSDTHTHYTRTRNTRQYKEIDTFECSLSLCRHTLCLRSGVDFTRTEKHTPRPHRQPTKRCTLPGRSHVSVAVEMTHPVYDSKTFVMGRQIRLKDGQRVMFVFCPV